MKVLLKSAASCLLALLLLGNSTFCWAANQALATATPNIQPLSDSQPDKSDYMLKSGQAFFDPSSAELAPNISALHPPQKSTLNNQQINEQKISMVNSATSDSQANSAQKFALSAVAYDTAKQLDIMYLIEQLDALKAIKVSNQADEIKRLQLKQKLTDSILIATLEVRDATARIERESSYLNRILDYLQDRRDKALKLNTLGNVLGVGAINEIGQAGEMRANEIPGEIIELIGGGITILLGSLSLRAQSGGKHQVVPKPNMLSKIFNRPTNKESDYPPIVWNYLNRVPLDGSTTQTRLESLFQRWRKYGIVSGKNGSVDGKRVASLTNTGQRCMESIDLISDQLALLSDIKAEIYQLDRDLLELLLNTQVL